MNRLSPARLPNSHHKSDLETRLPTSNKKGRAFSPKIGTHASADPHLLKQSILALQAQKQKLMHHRRYSWAEEVGQSIRRAKSQFASSRISKLLDQQRNERRSISEAHKTQMRYFQKTWGNYFIRLQERQSQILRCFKEEQERQVFQAQMKVQRQCRSLRSGSREVAELTRKQALLRQQEEFSYLKYVRKQLSQAVARERRKKEREMDRLAELEEERLSVAQSKKYSVLMSRLEEYRKDKERVYLREQKRLRQKYRNVAHQLEHEQTMEYERHSRIYHARQY